MDVSHLFITLDPTFKDQTEAHVYCRLQYKDADGNELTSQEINLSGESFGRFVQQFASLREGFLRFLAAEGHIELEADK